MVPFIWGTWNSQIHVDRKQKGVGQGQGGQGNKEVLFNRASLWEDRGFPDSSVGKEYTCNAGNPSLIPGLGRSSGKGTHYPLQYSWASLCGSAGKESTRNAGDLGSIPGSGRSPGEGNGYPLQYSGLENSMDHIVHGVAKSWTRLSNFHFHFTLRWWKKFWRWMDGWTTMWEHLMPLDYTPKDHLKGTLYITRYLLHVESLKQVVSVYSLSPVWLFVTPWTVAHLVFPRQEHWSGLPFPLPGNLPDPRIKLTSPALAGKILCYWATREVLKKMGANTLRYKTEIESQIAKTNYDYQGIKVGVDKLGDWGWHIHTQIYNR